MEARLLAIKLLGEYGVFWSQLASEIEAFQLHLVTNDLWVRVRGGREGVMLDGSPHDGTGHMEGAKEG